jgi:hypothetical protein
MMSLLTNLFTLPAIFRRKPATPTTTATKNVSGITLPAESTFYIRRGLTSPAVKVHNYQLLKQESKRFDALLEHMLSDLVMELYPNENCGAGVNVLVLLLEQADITPIIRDCLGLDPVVLDIRVQCVFYLFALGHTNLLYPVDTRGAYTADGIALLELQTLLDCIPNHIKALRRNPRNEEVLAELNYLLRYVGLL